MIVIISWQMLVTPGMTKYITGLTGAIVNITGR